MLFSSYPVNIAQFITPTVAAPDANSILLEKDDTSHCANSSPIGIAFRALATWNCLMEEKTAYHYEEFLIQADWLIKHEQLVGNGIGGWPQVYFDTYTMREKLCMSSFVQGLAISVLLRAYALTCEQIYLEVAERGIRAYAHDILDGGINTHIADEDIFFEEQATYPASHAFNGMAFALLGLSEYLQYVDSAESRTLFERGHAALHRLLPQFDTGDWTRVDLLHRPLATLSQHKRHAHLLHALATSIGCEDCIAHAKRWEQYHPHLQMYLARGSRFITRTLAHMLRACLFRSPRFRPLQVTLHTREEELLRICVPITAFPVMGGTRTVQFNMAATMKDAWRIEYLTQHIGPGAQQFTIHQFGVPRLTSPWQFPFMWLYTVAGSLKLVSLLRRNTYHLILPQDGIYTAAFAALVGKLTGKRVVCMDYGNLTLVDNVSYRAEQLKALANSNRWQKLIGSWQLGCYHLSSKFFAWVSVRLVDHFLIAGEKGDAIEKTLCDGLGISRSHITRYAHMIDLKQHPIFDAPERTRLREQYGIPSDALVITMICRLAPEKGIKVALEALHLLLTWLAPEQRERIRFLLVGEGPLREVIEARIDALDLRDVCKLWGEASREEALLLLGIADLSLHTGTRAGAYLMSMLEAMASGCAVVTSAEPHLTARLFTEGQVIAVPVGDVQQTARALLTLVENPERRQLMGHKARNYIAQHHSPAAYQRALLRTCYWSGLEKLLSHH